MTINISHSATKEPKLLDMTSCFMERGEYETKLTNKAEALIREIMKGIDLKSIE